MSPSPKWRVSLMLHGAQYSRGCFWASRSISKMRAFPARSTQVSINLPGARCFMWLLRMGVIALVIVLFCAESEYRVVHDVVKDGVVYVQMLPERLTGNPGFSDKHSHLLLFSSWGPSPEKDAVNNIILNLWNSWRPTIKPLVFASDNDVIVDAMNHGWPSLPETKNPECYGPPVFPKMFLDAMQTYNSTFYGFANADIAFGKGLLATISALSENSTLTKTPCLIIGKRTYFNFERYGRLLKTPDEVKILQGLGEQIHWSSDYFITTGSFPWPEVIPLSIGRPLFCRWIIAFALQNNIQVIDASRTIEALHLTTKDGNRSSWDKPGIHCNKDIISYSFPKVEMLLGRVECAEWQTLWQQGRIVIQHRKPSEIECPAYYKPDMKSVWFNF